MAAPDCPEPKRAADSMTFAEQLSRTNAKATQKNGPEGIPDRANSGKAGGGCLAFGGGAMGACRKNVGRIVVTAKT